MKLVLFDIDGILLQPGAVKFDYWNIIVKKHFNKEVDRKSIYMHGKTDREILFELVQSIGIKNPENEEGFIDALNDIGSVVSESIKNEKLDIIENVKNFIEALLEEKNIAAGLLTGNTYEKAKAKLTNCDLLKYFTIGAFGDATKVRSELVPLAMEDAKKKLKKDFNKENVYLVGDTIRDVQCAKEAQVKIIAVATGKETMDQLRQEKPDYLFKDFSDPIKIIDSIF